MHVQVQFPTLLRAFEDLIEDNVLKYNQKGHVTWHGRIQKQGFGNIKVTKPLVN